MTTMAVRCRIELGLREVDLIATCGLLPHRAGICGLVTLEIPRAELAGDIVALAGIPASDEGVLAVPVARWQQLEDGSENVELFDDEAVRLIISDYFAEPLPHVAATAVRLAQGALRRGFAQNLEEEPRHYPAEETTALVTVH